MANGHADAERFMNWRPIDGKDLDPLGQFNELETQVRDALTAIPLAVEELANLINSETFFQAKKTTPAETGAVFSQIDYLLRPVVKMVSHEFDDVVQTYRVHDEAPRTFKKLRHTLALLRGAKPPLRFPTARLWEYIASASTKADRGEPLEYKQSARISPRVEELKIRLVPGHTSLATST